MKTIQNLTGTISDDAPDERDKMFIPRKKFARTFFLQSDGYHGFYQLADGATTGHVVIKTTDLISLFETADANFKVPKNNGVKNTNGITSKQ